MNDLAKTENPEPKIETLLPAGSTWASRCITGPLLVVEGVQGVGFDESVEVTAPDGSRKTGRVLAVGRDEAVIELFGETVGLSLQKTRVRFIGSPLTSRYPPICWAASSTVWDNPWMAAPAGG